MRPRKFLALVCLVLLAGCVAQTPAPVIDKSRQSEYAYVENERICRAYTDDEFCHVVARGDTLFSISRRYGLSVVEIASRNNIKAPFIIRPGDLLVVRPSVDQVVANPPVPAQATEVTPNPRATPANQTNVLGSREIQRVEPVATVTPTQPTRIVQSAAQAVNEPVAAAHKMTLRTSRTNPGWQWPVPDEPLPNSSANGLDYVLADKTEIVAAISGKVIYAGAGLNKFRDLIIVDTGTSYLVAYEFNTSHAIKEGQQLQRGEVITRIAATGPAEDDRHQHFRFEIWAGGKPLNPNSVISPVARN